MIKNKSNIIQLLPASSYDENIESCQAEAWLTLFCRGHLTVHISNRPINYEPNNFRGIKPNTHWELLSYWTMYLAVLRMIGWSTMNDMTGTRDVVRY